VDVDAYLARIGATWPTTLADLQERHLMTVPFENLSIHLGEPIDLDEDALFDKVVTRRRGGFCYELNGLFAALLRNLGFDVTMLAARVHGRHDFGPLFDHLTLRVTESATPWPWLVDVGFGAFSRHPLRLDSRTEQLDPAGRFRIRDAEDGDGDLIVELDGKPDMRIERRPRDLSDFKPTCWYQQTSPDSHFTRSLICSRTTPTGRVSISGRVLIETVDGERHERALPDDLAVFEAYREFFGFTLDTLPQLRNAAA
jgi:N-hydroxyarylamine O-acetyltransferase